MLQLLILTNLYFFRKNLLLLKAVAKTAFNKSSGKKLFRKKFGQKLTFSKKVISKTPKTKTQKKMNNNVPRVTQNKEIKTENIPITINTMGLYINSIKNK